ncbi:MAG TPA: class I SAM-dependent methyltransferase [Pseudonocardia sp.]|jgi:trans-aconitate 2-methyltransferase
MVVQRGPREWDAVGYDALPLPHERWGQGVLAGLPLRGDERVLDVGAGTGRDTAALLDRLPRGHVVAVDGSVAMLDQLRRRLDGVPAERLSVLRADLTRPLVLDAPVDAAFSVATLHWLPDHAAVFRSLAGVLRPGGLLRAEWGGHGQLATIESALHDLGLPGVGEACNFATAEDARLGLVEAGFTDVETELVPDPVVLAPGGQLEAFLTTVVLGAVLDPLPEHERAEVVDQVVARLPEPVVGYVRLRARARRAGG